jgi:intraflagellar transport protein 122
MFSDMWMWEEAKRFAEHTPQIDLSELNRKQALSLERINAWEEAAQMHAASQDYARAIQIFAQVRLFYFVTSYD